VRFTCYCSSSTVVDDGYVAATRRFGEALARRGDELVYGGTAVGLMGVLADAVRAGGGRVTGVLPEQFVERRLEDRRADELVVVPTMGDRKREMIARADAFVALPGGFGTLEELLEVLTLKQLGYHRRPIVMLDVDGFWDRLLEVFRFLYDTGFAKPAYARLYHVAATPEELFAHVDGYDPQDLPTKWW
jgi:uncharacterized protein (TIGR00730 family)